MKILFFVLLVSGVLFNGCSVYEAVHAPSPVEYKHVRFGETRSETIAHLGLPKLSEQKGDQKVDYFEFQDGYNPASKARIIFYIAGDVFTACLAEVIWWPMEMAIFDGKFCRATVIYGPDGLVKTYEVTDKKGKQLWALPASVAPATVKPSKQSPSITQEINQSLPSVPVKPTEEHTPSPVPAKVGPSQ